jgi:hypothetical protein
LQSGARELPADLKTYPAIAAGYYRDLPGHRISVRVFMLVPDDTTSTAHPAHSAHSAAVLSCAGWMPALMRRAPDVVASWSPGITADQAGAMQLIQQRKWPCAQRSYRRPRRPNRAAS